MKIPVADAQRFSNTLLQLYAARSERELAAVLAAQATTGEGDVAAWLAALLAEHAGHCRERLHRELPQLTGPSILTRREQEVLQRIAMGETDAAIGHALGIAPKTASKHVENILRKLGVETRTAAVATALDRSHVSPAARRPVA